MEQRGQAFSVNLQGPAMDPGGAPHALLPDGALDGKKTATALLFSGVFLALVGITFTAMGWHQYHFSTSFEWPQMLGPVLISVGGTFVLTSVCRFGIISCWLCRQWDEEALEAPESPPAGHPVTISSINQPIMLHGGTAMLCFPPPYNFMSQEEGRTPEFQPGGVFAALPPMRSVDNAAFAAEEEGWGFRAEKTAEGGRRGGDDESDPSRERPPAYEDLYPSFDKQDLT